MAKGFGKVTLTEPHQTFRVDYKRIDPETLDEEDIETRLLKVPLRKGDAVTRRHLMAAWVGCFLQSPEAEALGLSFLLGKSLKAKY